MKTVFSFILTFLLLVTSSSCKTDASDPASSLNMPENGILLKIPTTEFSSSDMRLDSIKLVSFPSVINANGLLDVPPNNRTTINAFMGGYVKDFPLLIGDKVRAGQKLLTLENLEFLELQQHYLEAGQRMKYLEAEYKRQKQLYEENINSQKVFMQAENEYERIKILRQGLRKKMLMIQIDPDALTSENMRSTAGIYSPIAGSVTKVFVNSGTHVTPDDAIMEIVNSDQMHLEIQIFEKDALKIEKGQKIMFMVPEYSEKVFSAEVHLIGRSVDADRTIKIHADLEQDQKEKFIPGMFVQAEILAEAELRPALPAEAFADIDGKTYLFQLTDQDDANYTFRKIEVKRGVERNGFIEVDLSQRLQNMQYLVPSDSRLSR